MTVSTVTTALGPSTSHLAVAGTVPLTAHHEVEMKEQQEDKQQDEKMNSVLEKLVDSQPLQGSGFKYVVRCTKCGWQTLQQDEDAGKKLVLQHAQIHWPEIQALIAESESGGSQSKPSGQEAEGRQQKQGTMAPRFGR